MKACKQCGSQLFGNVHFCPNCGTAVEEEPKDKSGNSFSDTVEKLCNTPDTTAQFTQEDISENRGICFFAYLSILVLVPLFANPKSKYARFHSNQGLILFLCSAVLSLAQAVVSVLSKLAFSLFGIFGAVITILQLCLTALAIIGLVNVYHNRAKELPLIGSIRLLK